MIMIKKICKSFVYEIKKYFWDSQNLNECLYVIDFYLHDHKEHL